MSEEETEAEKPATQTPQKAKKPASPVQTAYTAKWLVGLTNLIRRYYPNFDSDSFIKDVSPKLIERPLRQRITATARALGPYMPDDYKHALAIIREITPRIPNKMAGLFIPEYIGIYGAQDWDRSIPAIRYLTTLFPAEYGVRHFFDQDFGKALDQCKTWAEDDQSQVRRLAVMASRPKLPDATEFPMVRKNPDLTWDIIDALKTDSSQSVRRATSEHLRDIADWHPDWVIEEIQKWDLYNPKMNEIAKRATRPLYKERHPGSFAILGFDVPPQVKLENFRYKFRECPIGERQAFAFDIVSRLPKHQKLAVDFKIYYLQEDGEFETKIQRLKAFDLGPKATKKLEKKKTFRSTKRKPLFPGQHRIEILVNGTSQGAFAFNMIPERPKKAKADDEEKKSQDAAARMAAEVGGVNEPGAPKEGESQ